MGETDKQTTPKDLTIEELKKLHKEVCTDDVLSKLEKGFNNDFTNEEASRNAGINPATYYNWCNLSSEFREKMEVAKQFVAIAAKHNWADAVANRKDVEASIKYLERRQKKLYAPRVEATGEEGKDLNTTITFIDGA